MNQVLVSSGVIFGVHGLGNLSYHIAKGLYEHNMLEKVFAWDYKKTDLPDNKIKRIVPMGYYLEKVLGGFRNRIYKDFPQYLLQCEFFDIMCSYYTNSTKANIVYGGGGTTLRTMKRLKKKGLSSRPKKNNCVPTVNNAGNNKLNSVAFFPNPSLRAHPEIATEDKTSPKTERYLYSKSIN